MVPLQESPGPAFITIGMHRIIKSFIMATVPIDALKTRYFCLYSVIYTVPNWNTLGIMVITQFNHIMAFF